MMDNHDPYLDLLDEARTSIKYSMDAHGGCDHRVELCFCPDHALLEVLGLVLGYLFVCGVCDGSGGGLTSMCITCRGASYLENPELKED